MLPFKEFNPEKDLTEAEKNIIANATKVKQQPPVAAFKSFNDAIKIRSDLFKTSNDHPKQEAPAKSLIELELLKKEEEEKKKAIYNEYYKKFKAMMFPESETKNLPTIEVKWVKITNKSGEILYINKDTGDIVDKPPQEMQALLNTEEDNWYWVKDPVHVWIPGHLEETANSQSTFLTPGGEKITIPSKEMQGAIKFNKRLLLAIFHDLLSCEERSEPFILYNITNRYYKDNIYTLLGDILIAVNPYKSLPIYTSEYITNYQNDSKQLLPPHIFQIAEKTIANIIFSGQSQVIFITGESGSGKTESMKLLMKYINNKCVFEDSVLERKFQLSTPLIEAFGNSKTVENDNSSRFCKWVELKLETNRVGLGKIVNCNIFSFLLEKSRVSVQNKGERKYIINTVTIYSIKCYLTLSSKPSISSWRSAHTIISIRQE
jgi:hypothetical protein